MDSYGREHSNYSQKVSFPYASKSIKQLVKEFGMQYTGNEFTWDTKKPGVIALMAKTTGDHSYYTSLGII